MNQTATHEPWYNKTWLVILLCLFVFPVGLFALWKSGKLGTGWKVGITVVIGLLVVAAFSDPKTADKKAPSENEQALSKEEEEMIKEAVPQNTSVVETVKEEAAPDGRLPMWNEPQDFKAAFNRASAKTN